MKRIGITDLDVCRAVAEYTKNRWNLPHQALAKKFKCNENVAYDAIERAYNNGWIEYGTSLESPWLTRRGKKLLETTKSS